jgi:hypothetical protein
MGINLIVSNVRGSVKPMYIGRARIAALYPISILSPGGGINVTCMGYVDDIHFGVTIEPSMFPAPERLMDGLRVALANYLGLVGKAVRRGRRASVTKARISPRAGHARLAMEQAASGTARRSSRSKSLSDTTTQPDN